VPCSRTVRCHPVSSKCKVTVIGNDSGHRASLASRPLGDDKRRTGPPCCLTPHGSRWPSPPRTRNSWRRKRTCVRRSLAGSASPCNVSWLPRRTRHRVVVVVWSTIDQGYATHTLLPLARQIEGAWDRMIPGGQGTWTQFDFGGLLRASALERLTSRTCTG
jgi:hypothetical protein